MRLTLAVLLCTVVFLWEPITQLGTTVYSPGDISQRFPLLRVVEKPGRPQNELLSDPVTEMEPWLEFNRSELLQGRLPLLNPYNGGGVPHLANAQSAVLSPFSLPHYLLPKSPAYLLSALLKLLAAGVFMLLFLRQLGLSPWATLLGAIGYAFCAHNLLLLSYPHVGAAALLPAMLYFTERVLVRHETEGRIDRPGLGGLALSYGLCALSGQPEPLFFGALISAVYMAWRLSSRIRHAPDRGAEWARIRPLCLGLGAAVLISILISAVQLLPFIEYMQLSRLAEQRDGTQTPLPRALWPLYAYPDLLGNPSLEYYLHSGVPPINYEAANSAYIGALMLFMAMVSLAVSSGKRTHTFFGAVMILWVLWAYDFWGINRWIAHLPLIGIAPINRSQFVFALAASICAAFLLDRLINLKAEQRVRFALGFLLAATVSMAWFHAGTESLMERSLTFVKRLPNRTDFPLEQMPAAAWAHVGEVQLAFAAGVLSLAVVALASKAWLRIAGCTAIATICFIQTGWLHRGYNPVTAIEQHMPKAALIEKLASSVGDGNLAIVGTEALPPSMNMPYGIRLLANYDGMWVGGYDRLYRSRFGTEANWRTMNRADTRSFELFGAEYLLTLPGWQPIDTLFPGVPWNPRAFMNIEPVKPGNDLIQTFTVPTGSLSGVRFWVDMRGSKPDGIWAVRVRDAGSFELIYEHQLDSQQLVPGPDGFAEVVLEFPPLHQSQGRLLRLRMECQELRSGDGLRPVVREDMSDWQNQMLHDQSRRWNRESRKKAPPSLAGEGNAHPDLSKWKLFRGTAQSGGGLAMDLRVGDGLPPAIDTIGPYALHKLPTSQRYRIVGQAITVSGPDAARLELDHPGFVPNSMVVLESEDTPGVVGTAIAAGVCEILEEDSTTASLRVKVDSPGWLVTSKPYLPGWKVQMDGKDIPTLLANEGFLAVQVPVGIHRIDIRYSPASAMTGTWMTVLGVMLLVLLWRTRATPAS